MASSQIRHTEEALARTTNENPRDSDSNRCQPKDKPVADEVLLGLGARFVGASDSSHGTKKTTESSLCISLDRIIMKWWTILFVLANTLTTTADHEVEAVI